MHDLKQLYKYLRMIQQKGIFLLSANSKEDTVFVEEIKRSLNLKKVHKLIKNH